MALPGYETGSLSSLRATPPGSPGPLSAMAVNPTLQRQWSRRRSTDEYRAKGGSSGLGRLLFLVLISSLLYAFLRVGFGVAHQACTVVSIAVLYAGFTETVRIQRYRGQQKELSAKVRELLEARRAAGLQRLGTEVAARQQSWPRPPYSYTATVLGRFDNERVTPMQDREVNYRALAGDAVSKVLELVESIEANQGATKALLVHSWLMQRLMHEGPSPEKDSQMFQELHKAIDIAERRGESRGYYCRLCLGYQTSGLSKSFKVQMGCGRCLCSRCAKELVEGVLQGRLRLPLACPTGNCTSMLTPSLVEHILEEEDFERFKRMHDVKMSLDRSAPHEDGLAARLAEARRVAGMQTGPTTGTSLTTVVERSESRDASPSTKARNWAPTISPKKNGRDLGCTFDEPDGKPLTLLGAQSLTIRSSPKLPSPKGSRPSISTQPGEMSPLNPGTLSPGGTPPPGASSPREIAAATSFTNLLQPLISDTTSAKKHSD